MSCWLLAICPGILERFRYTCPTCWQYDQLKITHLPHLLKKLDSYVSNFAIMPSSLSSSSRSLLSLFSRHANTVHANITHKRWRVPTMTLGFLLVAGSTMQRELVNKPDSTWRVFLRGCAACVHSHMQTPGTVLGTFMKVKRSRSGSTLLFFPSQRVATRHHGNAYKWTCRVPQGR